MTDDELDLLASAYLDGEATSEEVDMVERDPEAMARVEALRSISEQVAAPVTGPSAEVKEQHLAAALSAFTMEEAPGAESSDAAPAPVIDMTQRAGRPRSSTRSTTRETAASQGRTMPRWLPAAAALLLFGGAGAIIASQGIGGDDDATETASFDTDASDESAEEADFDESTETQAAESGMADDAGEAMEMGTEADTEGEARADEAMDEEEAMEDAAESAPAAEDSEGGFFPEEPVLSFASVPDPNQILRDQEPELRQDISQTQCGDFAGPLTDGFVLGYLPVEVAGEPAEYFVLVRENDTQSAVILAVDGCQPIIP